MVMAHGAFAWRTRRGDISEVANPARAHRRHANSTTYAIVSTPATPALPASSLMNPSGAVQFYTWRITAHGRIRKKNW
jgi:hypothetical protein